MYIRRVARLPLLRMGVGVVEVLDVVRGIYGHALHLSLEDLS